MLYMNAVSDQYVRHRSCTEAYDLTLAKAGQATGTHGGNSWKTGEEGEETVARREDACSISRNVG